ncbi:MAG: DUF935 family protein [Fervidobacterium sp.]|nr:DUF935 family protein [Fervidobacterium sp.]
MDLKRELITSDILSRVAFRDYIKLTPSRVAEIINYADQGYLADFAIAADDVKERDLHYKSVLQTRIMSVASLEWTLEITDKSSQGKKIYEFVYDVLKKLNLFEAFTHLLDAIAKGWSVAEIVWDTSGKLYVPAELKPVDASLFMYKDGKFLIDDGKEGIEIPQYKAIIHRYSLSTKVAGGVARNVLWAWVFKSFVLRDWARFLELFAQPIRIGKYHAGATQEDVNVLKQAVFNLGSDAAAVIPAEMAIEFVEAGGKASSGELYHKLIQYIDKQVSKVVLGQTMTVDEGSSYAQAKIHQEVRYDLLKADATSLAQTIQKQLIEPLVEINFGKEAQAPVFKFIVAEPEDQQAFVDNITKLVQIGVEVPHQWIRAKLGIPEPTEVEEHSMQKINETNEKEIEEYIADRLEEETEEEWMKIVDKIRDLVFQAESLEDLRDKILNAFGYLQDDKLADIFALAFTAAELAGRYTAIKESKK